MAAMKRLLEQSSDYTDGEILDVDTDGCLIMWDNDGDIPYNCGETLEGYGVDNLTQREADRLKAMGKL